MTGLRFRPATADDVPVLTELWRGVDTQWFGSPEHDENEVGEELDLLDDLANDTRLGFSDGRLVSAVLSGRHESAVLALPGAPRAAVHDALDWVTQRQPARIEVLDRDAALLAALIARRWRHSHSSFELARPVSDGWPVANRTWPGGVELRQVQLDDLDDIHHLIYVDASFADVPGHILRGPDEWHRMFVGDRSPSENIVLARRADRFVGVSIVRVFSDGLGWISQLAVAPSERGRGLGRALVLESFCRLAAAGATSLGLGVMAANRGALGLYLSLGLSIDREWQIWDAPAPD